MPSIAWKLFTYNTVTVLLFALKVKRGKGWTKAKLEIKKRPHNTHTHRQVHFDRSSQGDQETELFLIYLLN